MKFLCNVSILKEFDFAVRFLTYVVWIKSYPHVDTNVEISCLNRNNFGIIKFIKLLAAKSNSLCLKSL